MFRPHGASRVCHQWSLAPSCWKTTTRRFTRSTTLTNDIKALHRPASVSTTSAPPTPSSAATSHTTPDTPSFPPTSPSATTSTRATPEPEAAQSLPVSTPSLLSTSTSAPASTILGPELISIVRPARVGVHALPDQPIQAPALARHSLRPSRPLHPLHPSTFTARASHGPSTHLGPFCPPASPHRSFQARGKKTKTTVKLSDLPQGLIQPGPQDSTLSIPDDEPQYPTVVLQARQNMRKFDNCVLLTRVGGFYELYFEHAEEYGPLLNLKVASKRTNAGPVPMAGFPFFQLDRFLKILVQDLNRHVAVAEEFPNSALDKVKSGGLIHDRRVARIITPGTLIDENFMDPFANNYVMAIYAETQADSNSDKAATAAHAHSLPSCIDPQAEDVPLGLAWLDLSTGLFSTQQANAISLPSILSRVCPRELVLDQGQELNPHHTLFDLLDDDHRHLITYSPQGDLLRPSDWLPMLEAPLSTELAASFSSEEVLAVGLVLNYIKHRLQGQSMKLQPPMRHRSMQIMAIDNNSVRALEVKQTIRDGAFRGSLLHAIRRTVTKNGARLLNEWLSAPSTSLDVISARQDLVARFISDRDLRDSIIILLLRSHDSQRLVQKFALGRGDADDLLGLASTIAATKDISALLLSVSSIGATSADCLVSMASRISLDEPLKLAHRIKEAIDEDGISHQHEVEESAANQIMALAENVVRDDSSIDDDAAPMPRRRRPTSIREYYAEDSEGWIMKPAASRILKRLHKELKSLLREKDELNDSLRERLGVSSLTLRWTPSLGHIAHIKGRDTKYLVDIKALSASRSTRSFHLPEWTALGQRLDQVRGEIRAEEQVVFTSLREQVVLNLVKLRRNAAVLAELDVTTSFAKLALEQNLVRPKLNNTTSHTIVGGRHPTVEGALVHQGRSFVQNDCHVGTPSQGRLWLITGPNMAGKSTFLRQNALITILAQIGCYVPASYAELGIVDAIFSRVGSTDNLYRDQSTFMVEMLETAQILKQATPRSFVIMDEIGRGTTPEDGTAVSFACLHHIATVNQCRTLFATHFHNVADLASAAGLCADGDDVDEDTEGAFTYVHKLRKGINRDSHALKVAKLAGLPELAIHTAQRILNNQALEPRESIK
ncbi:muts domain V-domain-containing protein [Mariannaea sp. PMI_226]|nr:muts domain V-domain-containing protein [Mariannaea sp. PMI_226]